MNIGDVLDNKYKIIDVLGNGAFGIVYLADDSGANRKVAIKALLEKESLKQNDLKREIEFLGSLKHKSIVTFHHHFIENGILYLVMEYCGGGNLDSLIRSKNQLSYDEALMIAKEICGVFEFIHNRDIIHRDIKPKNILIESDGTIKVADFGIANTHGGTVIYLAPEVFSSEYFSSKDSRVDIYALGITLLEMIIGKNPFLDSDDREMHAKKLNHSFVPTDLPQWLQAIILKATHPIPELRFQSASEFNQAIYSKSVPYIINKDRIRVDKYFELANKSLRSKNWKNSLKYIERGLEKENYSALGLMIAGKYNLKIHKVDKAREYFDQALKMNPSVNIRKELAEINIANGNYSQAISLLQIHLQLNPTDWESYNLLIECFFRLNRFETALEISEAIMEDAKQDCFLNNWFLIKYCLDKNFDGSNTDLMNKLRHQHFILENVKTISELRDMQLASEKVPNKLLYQDYRFNKYFGYNTIVMEDPIGMKYEFNQPIISIGRNNSNTYSMPHNSISRIHCFLINYKNDIWIYDAGSTLGTYVDGEKIFLKQFLLGKHKIQIGQYSFHIYTSNEIIL
ncbi:protein kinase domain-containing protein [Immundisolibacter sp.]